MGVPGLAKWLENKCKKAFEPCRAKTAKVAAGRLYLDMNGVVHNARTPEAIKAYITGLIDRIAPSQLVYFALDGVAPRAKMVQQRGRRFVKADDAADEPAWRRSDFDSNLITPGTPFMEGVEAMSHRLAAELAAIAKYAHLTFIVSDSSVPGEGEHKIMEFIRGQRAAPGYDPNLVHVIYGSDADMFFLSLLTGERHVYVLREKPQRRSARSAAIAPTLPPMTLVNIATLRATLAAVLGQDAADRLPFAFDASAAITDFVLVLMLVGNDFLPRAPTLDAYFGGLNTLVTAYLASLPLMGGFISSPAGTDLPGSICPSRLGIFLTALASADSFALRSVSRLTSSSRSSLTCSRALAARSPRLSALRALAERRPSLERSTRGARVVRF